MKKCDNFGNRVTGDASEHSSLCGVCGALKQVPFV